MVKWGLGRSPKRGEGGSPTLSPFPRERGLGIGIENLIYFIKSVLFLQADINMPLRNAGTICGKGVFVYIGKWQAVYIRLNEENYNISN